MSKVFRNADKLNQLLALQWDEPCGEPVQDYRESYFGYHRQCDAQSLPLLTSYLTSAPLQDDALGYSYRLSRVVSPTNVPRHSHHCQHNVPHVFPCYSPDASYDLPDTGCNTTDSPYQHEPLGSVIAFDVYGTELVSHNPCTACHKHTCLRHYIVSYLDFIIQVVNNQSKRQRREV